MAAEEKKDAGKPQEQPAAAKVKKGPPKTLIIIIAVTVLEASLFFGAMKMFGGGPQVAHGAAEGKDLLKGEDPHKSETMEAVEIELLNKFRVPNDKSGALFIYDLDLYVKVARAKQPAIEALVNSRKGELSDRVARIIRGNDAAVLNEADLKTLRTQIRNTLGDLAGDPEIIQEVLIPRCVPMRTE